jgi:hypothetical protein
LTSGGAGQSTLLVGNPGSCDSEVSAAGFTPPPSRGQTMPIKAEFGYIEMYTMAAFPCGDDVLWGVATPLNTSGGYSSSYTATALVGFNAQDETATTAGNAEVAAAIARAGGVDKEILLARWTADPRIGSSTQVVLTFLAGRQPRASDPVSMYVFDSEESINFSPRQVVLPREVNVCTLAPREGVTQLDCPATSASSRNGFEVVGSHSSFTGGWVRIIDNEEGNEVDSLEALPVRRFPALGIVFSTFAGSWGAFDQTFPLEWRR